MYDLHRSAPTVYYYQNSKSLEARAGHKGSQPSGRYRYLNLPLPPNISLQNIIVWSIYIGRLGPPGRNEINCISHIPINNIHPRIYTTHSHANVRGIAIFVFLSSSICVEAYAFRLKRVVVFAYYTDYLKSYPTVSARLMLLYIYIYINTQR